MRRWLTSPIRACSKCSNAHQTIFNHNTCSFIYVSLFIIIRYSMFCFSHRPTMQCFHTRSSSVLRWDSSTTSTTSHRLTSRGHCMSRQQTSRRWIFVRNIFYNRLSCRWIILFVNIFSYCLWRLVCLYNFFWYIILFSISTYYVSHYSFVSTRHFHHVFSLHLSFTILLFSVSVFFVVSLSFVFLTLLSKKLP